MRQEFMELILISASKLKVMLSAEDMARYELSCDTIECENSPSRKGFWHILDEAKRQTGFDPGGERVFVQLYPERSGGCEMFVTKLGASAKKAADSGRGGAKEAVLRSGETHEEGLRECIYVFDALSDLLLACRCLKRSGGVTVSRAYADEGNRRFYLALDRAVPHLTEYNATVGGESVRTYMREHGRCFCRDAIEILGSLG